MAEDRDVTGTGREDEAVLAPFFAAARGAAPEPPMALLSAILGDAAEARPVEPVLAPVRARLAGYWRGAAALAACALLGFWIGLAGGVTIDGATLQAGTTAADGADPIETFFDLAAME